MDENNEIEREDAIKRLKIPAILLIVVGILGLLSGLYGMVAGGGKIAEAVQEMEAEAEAAKTEDEAEAIRKVADFMRSLEFIDVFSSRAMMVIKLLLCALVLVGGLKLLKGDMGALVTMGSIAAMIPLIVGPCCGCLGIPVGIWALIAVSKSKAALS